MDLKGGCCLQTFPKPRKAISGHVATSCCGSGPEKAIDEAQMLPKPCSHYTPVPPYALMPDCFQARLLGHLFHRRPKVSAACPE